MTLSTKAADAGWRLGGLIGWLPTTTTYLKDLPTDAFYDRAHLLVLVDHTPVGWHLSISHRVHQLERGADNVVPGRYPTWDEIVEADDLFLPAEVTMAMMLPPRKEWVNVHDTTFHLWEIDSSTGKPPAVQG